MISELREKNEDKRLVPLWLIVIMLLAICIGAALVYQESGQKNMKWEYTVQRVPDETFLETMNRIGQDRWELVFARRAVEGDFRGCNSSIIRYPFP